MEGKKEWNEILETEMVDRNDIVTIEYNNFKFEIDIWDDLILLPDELVDLFTNDNIETQPANLFFSRFVANCKLKNKIKMK
jgi:hypothetical protein